MAAAASTNGRRSNEKQAIRSAATQKTGARTRQRRRKARIATNLKGRSSIPSASLPKSNVSLKSRRAVMQTANRTTSLIIISCGAASQDQRQNSTGQCPQIQCIRDLPYLRRLQSGSYLNWAILDGGKHPSVAPCGSCRSSTNRLGIPLVSATHRITTAWHFLSARTARLRYSCGEGSGE